MFISFIDAVDVCIFYLLSSCFSGITVRMPDLQLKGIELPDRLLDSGDYLDG